MQYIEGQLYQDTGFINGYMAYEDGKIIEVNSGVSPIPDKTVARGLVFPLLTNFHTHLGDAVGRGRKFTGDVQSLVAPPNGLKFRILRESRPEDLIYATRKAIMEMLNTGTITFYDFRENGIRGVEILMKASSGLPIKPMIMGRPKDPIYSKIEVYELLSVTSGIGVSSIADWDYSELVEVAKETKRQNKLFALHASECEREDIDLILDLKPDFLIHMTYANDSDLEKISELGIPIVLCVRSNLFFNNIPNILKMLEKDVIIVLGTDNAMLNSCNLFEELKAVYGLVKKSNEKNNIGKKNLLNMLTTNLKKSFNPRDYINLAPGSPSNFMVIDKPKDNPELSLLNGVSPKEIKMINIGTAVWKV